MGMDALKKPGQFMAAEIPEAPGVFVRGVSQLIGQDCNDLGLCDARAFYTVARGSSDAAALVLAYEFMARLRVPATSLPPSVFSIGPGVDLNGSNVLVISQSGASDDLVRSARGARASGASVLALTNVSGSPVEDAADVTVPIGAGVERAVPATKTVIGSIAAGMALLGAIDEGYRAACEHAAAVFDELGAETQHPEAGKIASELLRAQHVYVIGRGGGFGAAQEVALKLKETCALHAEAYSASEVLHGPLQLVSKPLMILMLDTEDPATAASMDEAESRFRAAGATVRRVRASEFGAGGMCPAAASAALLFALYPIILSVALSLGFDPDAPANLAKVTRTA